MYSKGWVRGSSHNIAFYVDCDGTCLAHGGMGSGGSCLLLNQSIGSCGSVLPVPVLPDSQQLSRVLSEFLTLPYLEVKHTIIHSRCFITQLQLSLCSMEKKSSKCLLHFPVFHLNERLLNKKQPYCSEEAFYIGYLWIASRSSRQW